MGMVNQPMLATGAFLGLFNAFFKLVTTVWTSHLISPLRRTDGLVDVVSFVPGFEGVSEDNFVSFDGDINAGHGFASIIRFTE